MRIEQTDDISGSQMNDTPQFLLSDTIDDRIKIQVADNDAADVRGTRRRNRKRQRSEDSPT